MTAAQDIITKQISTIRSEWDAVCRQAALAEVERNRFVQRVFSYPFVFEGAPEGLQNL